MTYKPRPKDRAWIQEHGQRRGPLLERCALDMLLSEVPMWGFHVMCVWGFGFGVVWDVGPFRLPVGWSAGKVSWHWNPH